jgi:hypothetical protein
MVQLSQFIKVYHDITENCLFNEIINIIKSLELNINIYKDEEDRIIGLT